MRAAFSAASVPLLRIEPDGSIEAVNALDEQMVGTSRPDLIGRSIAETWDVDLFGPSHRLLDRLREGEQIMIEAEPVDRSTGLPAVYMRLLPIVTDGSVLLIGVWLTRSTNSIASSDSRPGPSASSSRSSSSAWR